MSCDHEKEKGDKLNIYNKLLKDRIVLISGGVDDELANSICAALIYLEAENPEEDITIYVNSPGGVVTSGMAIYDTMQFVKCDVSTVCIGQAASMGALLLAAGTPGKRFASPNARIMIHQPLGGIDGSVEDIRIHAHEMMRIKSRLNEILAQHTKQPLEVIEKDTDRDFFMEASEAVKYGLIDGIVEKRS